MSTAFNVFVRQAKWNFQMKSSTFFAKACRCLRDAGIMRFPAAMPTILRPGIKSNCGKNRQKNRGCLTRSE